MKLLGLRICDHDSNFTYFDGQKIRYLKTERKYQIKHHGVNDLYLWEDIIKEEWNVTSKDLDEVAIVFDPWHYGLSVRKDDFFPAIDYKDFPAHCPVTRVNHHYAHHLSCWPLLDNPHKYNGFAIDGWGDWDKVWTVFKNHSIEEVGSLSRYGSIGNEYALTSNHFDISAANIHDLAGKVMGMQSYGEIDYDFLEFLQKFDITDIKNIFDVHYYYGVKQHKLNWLRTIHEHVGNILLNFLSKKFMPEEVFCYTGGVALNVCWNTKLRNKFKNIVIPPHASDEGLSLGAIEYLRMKHNLPIFKINNFPFCQSDEEPIDYPNKKTNVKVAELLKSQKIVAWYQGKGEIGPRALGNRSILADPRDKDMKDRVNKIKKREQYRPFGCSTINKSFEESYYMLYTQSIDENKYPAICHIDKTCRHHTTNNNKILENLMTEYQKISNNDVLLNTSLNINGKPLVSNFNDCFNFFQNEPIDAFVFGNKLYIK